MNDFREYSNYCDRYLAHHGIKGQHWGVKNGPPYPLDKKVSKAIKAGKNETRSSDNGHKVGTQKTSAYTQKNWTLTNGQLNQFGGWDEFHKKSEEFQDQYRDTDKGLREVNEYKVRENDGSITTKWVNPLEMKEFKSMIENNFDHDSRYANGLGINDEAKREINKYGFSEYQEVVAAVNNYDKNNPYVSNNCSKCADCMELVKRGMNPNYFSAGRSKFGMMSSANAYHWDGAVDYKEKSYENIENRIKKFGNKGSGTIGIRRADGSGHAMHFSTVKDRETGEYRIEVQDGQWGHVYKNLKEALADQGHDPTKFCRITRLDNATPNIEHMIEDSVIRIDSVDHLNSRNGVRDLKNTTGSGDISINDWNTMNRNINAKSDFARKDWH